MVRSVVGRLYRCGKVGNRQGCLPATHPGAMAAEVNMVQQDVQRAIRLPARFLSARRLMFVRLVVAHVPVPGFGMGGQLMRLARQGKQ